MSQKNKSYWHKRLRRRYAEELARQPIPCCRCGQPITAGDRWHLDHYPIAEIDGGTEIHISHAACNCAAGQATGQRRRNAQRALELDALRAAGFYAELPHIDPIIARWHQPRPAEPEPSRIW